MFYKFRCKNCNKTLEVEIAIKDYDREKGNQFCSECKGKMDRVIEWSGIAEGSGAGWFGARGGSVI